MKRPGRAGGMFFWTLVILAAFWGGFASGFVFDLLRDGYCR